MKTKRILIAVGLIAILLAATTLVASAKPAFGRITGGGNYPYDLEGWAWGTANITFNPVTGEADGRFDYRSFTEYKPKNFGGWNGEAVCVAVGEYEGMPAVTIVVEVVGGNYWEYGTFAKFMIADGGNESEDILGLVVWDLENGPVHEMPDCDFEYPFWPWPNENGNFTLHLP